MAIAQIVCRGLGPDATIALLVTAGYSASANPITYPVRVDRRSGVLRLVNRGVGRLLVRDRDA